LRKANRTNNHSYQYNILTSVSFRFRYRRVGLLKDERSEEFEEGIEETKNNKSGGYPFWEMFAFDSFEERNSFAIEFQPKEREYAKCHLIIS